MDITTAELAKFQQWAKDSRRVVMVVNAKNGAVELDGHLKVAHEKGLMIKPWGRMGSEMAAMEQIEKIELYDERPKPIEPKRMAHVVFGSIRQHLADRHGFALEELNSPEFTEARAYDLHDEEHLPQADKMSHFHEG